MSQANPYQPAATTPVYDPEIRRVKVRPFELLQRGYDFISGQYWLFFGLSLVGMLIASAVPFGIIMGPMLVGIYLCFLARERGETVEFAKLFQGFDSFKESFIATLVIIAATFVVIIPLMLVFVVAMMFLIDPQQNGPNDGPPIALFALMFAFYVVLLLVNMLIVLPFMFTFQLIADRNVSGIDAVKLSLKAVRVNLFGLLGYLIITTVVSIVLMIMCYIPLFFFLPVLFASLFLIYRDIFPLEAQL
ncbi:hypothetical protein LF1_40960 [Rubripirellula obstinata]|uniref:Glycerophosphoryl diester phosphodiesterase membrane domain-containing protein n=1 Tax=Rubripirellula obstinata TaxID=406547 RepID=A0A5B1CLY3_9BACT|nr:hypothetical protein [Rubripirellula obstinata]KAA1261546.1 hypothetical protein LF1_40960 [Rubripirellula obstinata]